MRKFLSFMLVCSLCLGFVACGGDDDEEQEETYFRIKGATEEGSRTIRVNLENEETVAVLDIETNQKDWTLEKETAQEIFWYFDEDFSTKVNKVTGSGNGTVKVYLEKNPNQQDRTAHIYVYYKNANKKSILIKQKGKKSDN